MKKILLACLILSVLLLSSCRATNHSSLIRALERGGFEPQYVESFDAADGGGIYAPVRHYRLNNAHAFSVYTFESAQARRQEATRVSSSGSTVGPVEITWMCTPHWFGNGTIIVLYVGCDEDLIDFLTSTLGAPFAGGDENHQGCGQC